MARPEASEATGACLVRQRLTSREHSSVRQYVFSSCLPRSTSWSYRPATSRLTTRHRSSPHMDRCLGTAQCVPGTPCSAHRRERWRDRPRNRRASLAEQARAGSARACRRNQVRTCFAAGGRWIRTIGPPRMASSVGEPCHATSGGVRGTGLGSAVDRAFSCTASHSMQPGAYTVFTGGGLPCCAAVSASWR